MMTARESKADWRSLVLGAAGKSAALADGVEILVRPVEPVGRKVPNPADHVVGREDEGGSSADIWLRWRHLFDDPLAAVSRGYNSNAHKGLLRARCSETSNCVVATAARLVL